jgi:hypothetical protein
VWTIFVCSSKHSLLWDSPLAFILEGVMISFPIFFLCSLIGAHFFYASWAYTFFLWPLSPFAIIIRRETSLNFGVFIFAGWMAYLHNSPCRS